MRMCCAPCIAVPVQMPGGAGMPGTLARSALACVLVSMLIGNARADVGADAAGELKHMSVEELMDIQVTSVARHPEPLQQAAAAIQVITREDIRRSGATRIPEALRRAGNLGVT